MMWGPQQGRALARIALAALSGVVVSWLGLAALVALTIILWPGGLVPLLLLGVWLCAIVACLVWPGGRLWRDPDLRTLILMAPLDPIARAGGWIWRALGL
jgi:hypothetical protein